MRSPRNYRDGGLKFLAAGSNIGPKSLVRTQFPGIFCRFPIFAQLKTNFHRILTGGEINHEREGNR